MQENINFSLAILMTLSPIILLLFSIVVIYCLSFFKRKRDYLKLLEGTYRLHHEVCENDESSTDSLKMLKFGIHCNSVLEKRDRVKEVVKYFAKLIPVSFIASLVLITVSIFN